MTIKELPPDFDQILTTQQDRDRRIAALKRRKEIANQTISRFEIEYRRKAHWMLLQLVAFVADRGVKVVVRGSSFDRLMLQQATGSERTILDQALGYFNMQRAKWIGHHHPQSPSLLGVSVPPDNGHLPMPGAADIKILTSDPYFISEFYDFLLKENPEWSNAVEVYNPTTNCNNCMQKLDCQIHIETHTTKLILQAAEDNTDIPLLYFQHWVQMTNPVTCLPALVPENSVSISAVGTAELRVDRCSNLDGMNGEIVKADSQVPNKFRTLARWLPDDLAISLPEVPPVALIPSRVLHKYEGCASTAVALYEQGEALSPEIIKELFDFIEIVMRFIRKICTYSHSFDIGIDEENCAQIKSLILKIAPLFHEQIYMSDLVRAEKNSEELKVSAQLNGALFLMLLKDLGILSLLDMSSESVEALNEGACWARVVARYHEQAHDFHTAHLGFINTLTAIKDQLGLHGSLALHDYYLGRGLRERLARFQFDKMRKQFEARRAQ